MTTIYNNAYDLEKAIRNSDEYQQLKKCYDELNKDETGRKMYDNFRSLQMKLQHKQMKGEEISEEEVQTTQKQQQFVEQNEVVSKLLEAEQRMGSIINDVNGIITKSLEELYDAPEKQVK